MIRKEAYVHSAVMDELRRIIEDSEIMAEVCRYVFFLFVKNAIRHILVNLLRLHMEINLLSPLFLKAGTNL